MAETAIQERRKSPLELLTERITAKQDGIMAILPSHTNPERFIKSALLVISHSAKLQECTPASVITSVYQAAELGLDFTPAKKLAYLVPFNNKYKDADGVTRYRLEASFMPGYKGLEQLAVNAKAAKRFSTQIVYERDVFSIQQGTAPMITHTPTITGDRGHIIGAYTISWQEDGSFQFTFMRKDELDAIRKRSKASGDGPWVTDTEEMYKKTVIRRHTKSLQLSPDKESDVFAKAIEIDNEVVGLDDTAQEAHDTRTRTQRLQDLICDDAEYEDCGHGVQNAPEEPESSQPEPAAPSPETAPSEPETHPAEQIMLDYGLSEDLVLTAAEQVLKRKVKDFDSVKPGEWKKVRDFVHAQCAAQGNLL